MKIGDKVKYSVNNKSKTGVIHGVRKTENDNGVEHIIGYVIDTGKVEYTEKRYGKNGRELKDDFVQPEMIILDAEQVALAE